LEFFEKLVGKGIVMKVLNVTRGAVRVSFPVGKETALTDRLKTGNTSYTEFTFDCSRFEPKSFQDTFILVPVCTLQIFQQLGSLVNEPAQAPPVRNVPFKFAEVVPDMAYLKGQ
jgi:hypothetical protein